MSRREAREKAVQVLYQIDMRGIELKEAMKVVLEDQSDFLETDFLKQIVNGVLTHQDELDQAIKKYLRGWSFDRLALVDRAVLRIAAYEILHVQDIPERVSLNEALELTRAFGMEESVKYINAVLANLVKEKTGEAIEVRQGE